jgi:hypothetical protein
MTDTTEPAPLNQREMNQFITLAALPTLERALERLRWLERENADIKERIDKAYEDIALDQRTNATLRADLARANAERDPLAEMWAALADYQPQADRDGHGESWRRMCSKQSGAASFYAKDEAMYRAGAASDAASDAAEAALAATSAAQHAQSAIAAIRRANGVQP